jgi:hypothetical protein
MTPSSPVIRRHVVTVSDATGGTAELVARAALAQFQAPTVEVRRFPNVRTVADIRRAIEVAVTTGGIVVHTLVSDGLRRAALREGKKRKVVTIDVMGPLLVRLSELLRSRPLFQPGLLRRPRVGSPVRLEAVEYCLKHDDGQNPFGLDRADIVLVGASRTSKTPLSLYLSLQGWFVANVPVILNLPLPGPLTRIDQGCIVGLFAAPERLVELRRARLQHPDAPLNGRYANLEQVRAEVRYSRSLFRKAAWPVIDMTSKSVEEAANEVLALVAPRGAPEPVGKRRAVTPRRQGATDLLSRRPEKGSSTHRM